MSKFKVGDKVYCPKYGNNIYTLDSSEDEYYPICIKNAGSFTEDGKLSCRDKVSSIFPATFKYYEALKVLHGGFFKKPKDTQHYQEIKENGIYAYREIMVGSIVRHHYNGNISKPFVVCEIQDEITAIVCGLDDYLNNDYKDKTLKYFTYQLIQIGYLDVDWFPALIVEKEDE